MIVSALRALGVTVVAAGVTLAGGIGSAQAAAPDGQVTTRAGLSVRSAPSTHAAKYGVIGYHKVFPLDCKVQGTSVKGNDRWYSLPSELDEWVSARYVRNIGPAPAWCTGNPDQTSIGRTTAALTKRQGPTRADAARGTLAKGARITLICKVRSQPVGGNRLWYFTSDHRWVSARYVDNVNGAPWFC